VYENDPAACFVPKGTGLRETVLMARMQKAAAVMQFKLEGQMIARNPEWGLDGRRLLHRIVVAPDVQGPGTGQDILRGGIDQKAGTVTIDGRTYPLKDTHFPTLDPANPYELSAEEKSCLARLKQSFRTSQKLWEHMKFL